MDVVYEEAEAWTEPGLGDIPPLRSHHHVQMGQMQAALQVKVPGAMWGNDPSAVGIMPSTEPPALLGSALALPNDREASAAQR